MAQLEKITSIELISEFSKVPGYKMNTQKLIIFLYTDNEHMENKTRNTILFISASKKLDT